MKILTCNVCGGLLSGKQKLFCSTGCKNRKHQSYEAQKARGIDRKLILVRMMGGQCSVCGYSKNLAAFAFHHMNSEIKKFKLDVRSLSNRTWEAVIAEVAKCSLVCANCHAELHNPNLDLDRLL